MNIDQLGGGSWAGLSPGKPEIELCPDARRRRAGEHDSKSEGKLRGQSGLDHKRSGDESNKSDSRNLHNSEGEKGKIQLGGWSCGRLAK